MPGVARVGVDRVGGGIINQALQNTVTLEGYPVVINNAGIVSHGGGVHGNAKMASASSTVTISGVGICRQGDIATCSHFATGSDIMSIG